ncbi:MAG: hypothetical protein DIZ80_10735 [endosymbiont of Galathealinum brachiosum]|uniref:Uroporphyrinogen-III synthase n=1 Tax=endosymbiont of Galathealinum brachiosum TaxID=2200906 RepID=A0A370DEZ6_9GAMM|nr:MAG: hypothetical protein DIZ80_10735 [endosymbiont of Galathealinum brachiosum]
MIDLFISLLSTELFVIRSVMSESNKIVLVTRPQQQAAEFIGLLKDKGINSLPFPSIEIQAVELNQSLKKILDTLNRFDLIFFISVNAVRYAEKALLQAGIEPDSITAKIATIGKATFAVAKSSGFNVTLSPDNGFNSDSLLALNELQAEYISNTQCLIFRGAGGLDYLSNELQKRGAQVQYAEVYKRTKPLEDKGISRLQLSEDWSGQRISVITVTSNESLQNLYDMLERPGKDEILKTPLVVASSRGFELAKSLGFKTIQLASSAMNHHMLEAVEKTLK